MKTYSSYMQEITKDELLEGLLGYGMFAEKLPPIFTSKPFYDYYVSEVNAGRVQGLSCRASDYVRYDSIRHIDIPRALAIPNPLSYAALCKCLSDNWDNLKTHFTNMTSNQKHKVSRVHIRKIQGTQSLFEMSYKNPSCDGDGKDDIIDNSRYRVTADISNCFPSIYTHAIPWAIKGKPESKSSQSHWSDNIDKCCREMKSKETSGILIGPHSSNIISEIILCRIDNKLVDDGFIFTRHIDDYSCYAKTLTDAERFLLCLNKHLKEYELSINQKKVQIIQLPETSETDWVYKLNSIYLGNERTKDGQQILPVSLLKTYLDVALRLTLDNKDACPLNYAIKVISSKYLGRKAIVFYVRRLKHLVTIYPYLARLMEQYVFSPFHVENNEIDGFINFLYNYGIEHNRYEASSYALYWSMIHQIPFQVSNPSDVIGTNDCVFMLMSYLYAKQNGFEGDVKRYKDCAKKLKGNDMERFWLFVYEILSKDELPGNLKHMKQNHISFLSGI